MKFSTILVLVGCVAAVVVVATTDKLFKPVKQPARWVCVTDAECGQEDAAHERGERCLRVSDKLYCYQPLRD